MSSASLERLPGSETSNDQRYAEGNIQGSELGLPTISSRIPKEKIFEVLLPGMSIDIINRTSVRLPMAHLRRDATKALGLLGQSVRSLESLVIVFVGPSESKAIKRTYLKKNAAANVLSFNYGRVAEIILTPAVIRREARELGEIFTERVRFLLVHGIIHIAGFDHEGRTRERNAFNSWEKKLIQKLHIKRI